MSLVGKHYTVLNQIEVQPIEPSAGSGKAVLTVDVEEWFHVDGVPGLEGPDQWARMESRVDADIDRLLTLLDKHDARATFFFLGWLAEAHPDLVARVAGAGHEIGCHGHLHRPVSQLDPETFEEDLARSLRVLREQAGGPVIGFRAPVWSMGFGSTPWAFEILARHGIRYDSSLTRLPFMGDKRHPVEAAELVLESGEKILEFPPVSGRLCGFNGVFLGGAWPLRLFGPGRALKATRRVTGRGLPAVYFIHPWELDPDPPRFPMPAARRFVHYAGLERGRRIWQTLLGTLEFVSLADVAGRHKALY